MLARSLSATGAERARALELARAEARGDGGALLAHLPACAREPACAAVTRDLAARLKRPGDVEVLQYRPSSQVPMTTGTGTGRLAWRAGRNGLPVVQCIRVRREGPLSGAGIELLSISAPIRGEAACP